MGSGCSFVDRDRDAAAAVALGEVQNGFGQKLVDAAGEITEEGKRTQAQKDSLSDPEKHTFLYYIAHIAFFITYMYVFLSHIFLIALILINPRKREGAHTHIFLIVLIRT